MVLNWQALTVTLKMGKSECKVLKITVHAFGFQSFAGRKQTNMEVCVCKDYVLALKVKTTLAVQRTEQWRNTDN